MYVSATNQGLTATIDSAMSGRVGGGGVGGLRIHSVDTYCGGAEYKHINYIKETGTKLSHIWFCVRIYRKKKRERKRKERAHKR